VKFLPIENIVYKTKLKEDEIIERLSDFIEPRKTFRFRIFGSDSMKSYEGQITGQTFDIKRIIGYRNSFLPRINGTIKRDYDGTAIEVKMRLHIFVIIFLCVWCGFACMVFLTQVLSSPQFNSVTLTTMGALIFVYAMTMGGFKFESNRSKKDLQTLFEAEIIKE